MERKLASVQKVLEVNPIEGADKIEQIKVLGWSLVAKKGEFNPGSKCVFFEIDSVLPEKEWSEFMRPSNFRVKTRKMKGCLSQGLALPLSTWSVWDSEVEVGMDLTKRLEVTKYEPPTALGLDIAGVFPYFIPKTDEMRIQSVPEVLEEMKGKEWYYSIKLDGTSGTYAKYQGEFYECSRNYRMKPNCKYYGPIAQKYKLEEKLPEGYAVQGEIVGESIQKNKLNIKGLDYFVFNVFDITEQRYLNLKGMQKFCVDYGLQTVPILIPQNPFWQDETIGSLLQLAEGKYDNTSNEREGIVIRPIEETYSSVLNGRLSFKAISNKFLLKGGED